MKMNDGTHTHISDDRLDNEACGAVHPDTRADPFHERIELLLASSVHAAQVEEVVDKLTANLPTSC